MYLYEAVLDIMSALIAQYVLIAISTHTPYVFYVTPLY